MQKSKSQLLALFFPLFLLVSTAHAQYLVSSKAGFVNRVEGKVSLQAQGSAPDEMSKVSLASQMKEGDRISTSVNSHAELLLAPGSYMRMNEKTVVEAVRTDLENTRFDVVQGAVIIEVGEIDKKFPVEIGTPRSVVTINKAGIYRLDVNGKDVAVSVRKGEAFLGTREQLFAKSATKVTGNKVYRLVGDGAPQTAKLSSKVFDVFDQWSYLRAESLVAANYSMLQRTRSRSALLSGWIYDPFSNNYTFVPSSWLFVTPYGFGFYRRYSDCEWCYGGYYNPYYSNGSYSNGGTMAGGGNGGGTTTTSGGAPVRGTDETHPGRRAHSIREVPSRQVEPYSRPTVFTPPDRSSRGNDSPAGFDSSRSASYPSSSPSSSPTSVAPSRADTGTPASSERSSGGGRGDSSRAATGPRGN